MPIEIPELITVEKKKYKVNVSSSVVGIINRDKNILYNGIMQSFQEGNMKYFVANGSCVALKCEAGTYYLYDPHSRDRLGRITPNGCAVQCCFVTFTDMVRHIHRLYHIGDRDFQYDITSCTVQLLGENNLSRRVIADLNSLNRIQTVPIVMARSNDLLSHGKRYEFTGSALKGSKSKEKKRNSSDISLNKVFNIQYQEGNKGKSPADDRKRKQSFCEANVSSPKRKNNDLHEKSLRKRSSVCSDNYANTSIDDCMSIEIVGKDELAEDFYAMYADVNNLSEYYDNIIHENPDFKLFKSLSDHGPKYVCCFCDQTFFKKSVRSVSNNSFKKVSRFKDLSNVSMYGLYICLV